jgi:colanic acid biosynthesis glycosyl transferase WcaI
MSSTVSNQRVFLIYHYFYPDDVVSAEIYHQLAEELSRKGHNVSVLTSNRSCHAPDIRFARTETRGSVHIRRFWRPKLLNDRTRTRLLYAALLWVQWFFHLLITLPRSPGATIVYGTDPQIAFGLVSILKKLFPRVNFIHWCFDMYPDGAVAAGLAKDEDMVIRLFKRYVRSAYRASSNVISIGPRMQRRFSEEYGIRSNSVIVPWAVDEVVPDHGPISDVRHSLFGNARLGLLYSGNMGRAHPFDPILDFLASIQQQEIALAIAVRGFQAESISNRVRSTAHKVRLLDRATPEVYAKRLMAADIHVVSLDHRWSGIVVPSKFFMALAVGRPVLYFGPADSDIGIWIRELGLGWIIENDLEAARVAKQLGKLIDEPRDLLEIQSRCRKIYLERFCKNEMIKRFDEIIKSPTGPT